MNFEITTLDKIVNLEIINQIKDIFFLTSPRKTFKDEIEKEQFFDRWVSYYINFRQDTFFVALALNEEPKVLAYLTIEPDSLGTLDFFSDHPHYLIFKDLYQQFPAHLHINTHPLAQGLGIGSMLLTQAEKVLKSKSICGIHLITSPVAKNTHFYRRNGYLFEDQRSLNNVDYLFMGKTLC